MVNPAFTITMLSAMLILAMTAPPQPRAQTIAVARARILSGTRIAFSSPATPEGAQRRGHLVEFH